MILVLVALLASLISTQAFIDRSYRRRKVEKLLYLPSGRFLKPAVLGFDGLAADYYWLMTIGYFGGHYLSDQKYPWLPHILDLVTDLDPRFSIAYSFGGIVLAAEADRVDASDALLRKGMNVFPGNWKYPFFLGFNRFYYGGDLADAARWLAQASRLPESPEYLPRLVASLYAKAGRVEDAVSFLETVRDTVDDTRLRANIQGKINDIKAGRLPEGLAILLRERKG